MIVLDASAAIEWLLNTPAGSQVRKRISTAGNLCHAPTLLDLEVVSALRRLERAKGVSSTRAEEAVADLLTLPIVRHAHHRYLGPVWALRNNFTPYDAVYLALADALSCPVLTLDRKFMPAVAQGIAVEFI